MNGKVKILVIASIVIVVVMLTTIAYNEMTNQASFYPEWVKKNIAATDKIRDSSIPIINFDVDEKPGVLTIYMTEENAKRYNQAIDDLIDVPYEIVIQNIVS